MWVWLLQHAVLWLRVQAAAHEVRTGRGLQALGELRCATHQNGADTTAIRFEHCKSTPGRSPSLTFETEPKQNRGLQNKLTASAPSARPHRDMTCKPMPAPALQSSCAAACTRNRNTVCCSSHSHQYHKHLERASSLQTTTSLSYPSLIRHPSASSFSACPSWTIGASACAALHPPPSPLPPSMSPSRALRPRKRNAPVPARAP